MSEQKESSVLFSLKELMNLEEDRIRSEEAERAAAAAAAEKARAEAERAAREAEEARIRAEEDRRRSEEQRAREETARLEAIRHAEVEKARVEAEQRARLEAMTAQQHHERSLAAIKEDQGKKKLRNMLIIGGVSAVLVLGLVVGLSVKSSNENEAKIAAAAEQARQAQEERKKFEAQLTEQNKKVDSLMAQLSSASDEATRLKLQKQLEEERAKTERIRTSGGGAKPSGGGNTGAASKPCNCTPGDPLCSCL
jgi:colicin import membrane protein